MKKVALLLLASAACQAQLFTLTKDQMVRLTAKNPFERFEDGRPKVPDALLEKVRGLSIEEVWAVLPQRGYPHQFAGNWQILHPGKKLVGRVVTAQYMPIRPDVGDVIAADAKAKGLYGNVNQWVIDQLRPGDVLVVDLFGKIEGGTYVGDNLFTAIFAATKTGGLVVNGGVRDMEGIAEVPMPAYFRGVHPSALTGVMLTGLNIPITVGDATVMPGDVAMGDRGGIYFIPPHLVQEVVDKADETHIHDEWTKDKFLKGNYKSSELYSTPRDPKLKQEYDEYKAKKLGKK